MLASPTARQVSREDVWHPTSPKLTPQLTPTLLPSRPSLPSSRQRQKGPFQPHLTAPSLDLLSHAPVSPRPHRPPQSSSSAQGAALSAPAHTLPPWLLPPLLLLCSFFLNRQAITSVLSTLNSVLVQHPPMYRSGRLGNGTYLG